MARHFLVRSVQGMERGKDYVLRSFCIFTVAIVLLFALMAYASAQMAFPKTGDALAKFRWEQVAFSHFCLVGRVRAVNFNNLSQAEKAKLAEASEEEIIADIKKRCIW